MMKHYNCQDDADYLAFLGFKQNPFPVAPDDANFYLSSSIEEIIEEIVHGICARKGFLMLTGDVGLGKTTVTRRILKILETKQVCTSLVFHTSLKDVDLLREINRDFGIPAPCSEADTDQLGDQLERLNDFLVKQYRSGGNSAIIIDDAQNLDRESLELVRMISNLEVDQHKIVQILLVGQTELAESLNKQTLRQLNSRIVIRKEARSLSRDELCDYITFKLGSSGNQGRILLTASAYRRIFGLTRGNFRRVNLLMDRCLYAICQGGIQYITRGMVDHAYADLYPEKRHTTRRAAAVAASIVLPLLVAMGSWSLHLHTSRELLADATPDGGTFQVPVELAMASSRAAEPAANSPAAPGRDLSTARQRTDPAISAFLGIYQLEHYTDDFMQALKQGTLTNLSQRIYGETGYQLVLLSSVPDQIRNRYGALAFSVGSGQSPHWLLFWRPQLELKRFYYAYRGDEIVKLQQLLHDLQFYRYKLDGIVGRRLVNAVLRFQKQNGLPATGFPDTATLFWVCQQQEMTTNG